jgi:hypothetical protein
MAKLLDNPHVPRAEPEEEVLPCALIVVSLTPI